MKAALLCLLLVVGQSNACVERSQVAKDQFRHANICPSTGLHKGRCVGWVIDHINPLCNGGADAPINMQWQSVADAKIKDRWERKLCKQRPHP